MVTFEVPVPQGVAVKMNDYELFEYALRWLAQSYFDAEQDIAMAISNDGWHADWKWEELEREYWTSEELDERWPTPPQTLPPNPSAQIPTPGVITSAQVLAATQKLRQMSYVQPDWELEKKIAQAMRNVLNAEIKDALSGPSMSDLVTEKQKQQKQYPGKSIKFERKDHK
jgi:hypothetical protein